MISLKDFSRRTITALMVATMATTVFSGCTSCTSCTGDIDFSSNSNSSDSESNNSESSDSNSSDQLGLDDNTFGIKYKYWYDNTEADDNQVTGLTKTDDTFMGLAGLPVYTKDGKYYLQSGKKQVILVDGRLDKPDVNLLRTEQGDKVYLTDVYDADIDGRVSIFNSWKEDNGYAVDETMEEKIAKDMAEGKAEEDLMSDALLYVNGLKTNLVVKSNKIYPEAIFSVALNLGYVNYKDINADEKCTVLMCTAADEIKITFTETDSKTITASYSTNDEDITLTKDVDIGLNRESRELWLSPAAIERVLGYDVEICKNNDDAKDLRVNVVTDTHDKFANATAVSPDKYNEYKYEASAPSTDSNTESTPSSSSASEESKPTSSSTPASSSKPTDNKPTSSSSTPQSSSKPASSSKPVQSTSSREEYERPVGADSEVSKPTSFSKPAPGYNVYGQKSKGKEVQMPGGTFWKEGSSYYRSYEAWVNGEEALAKSEVLGEDPDNYDGPAINWR